MEKECKYSSAFLVLGLPLILSGPLVSGTKGFTSSEGLWPQPLIHFTNFLGDSEWRWSITSHLNWLFLLVPGTHTSLSTCRNSVCIKSPFSFHMIVFSCHMGLIQTFLQRHITLEFNIPDNSASNLWCPHLITAFPSQASSLYHSTHVEITLIAFCSYFSHVKVSLMRARAAPSLSFLFPSSVVL